MSASRRLLPILICSIVIIAPLADAQEKPTSDFDTVLSEETTVLDLPIVSAPAVLARFDYRGKQRDILISDQFKQAFAGPPYASPESFAQFTFFVYPLLSISQSDLDQAFEKRTRADKVGDIELYEMSWNLTLIDDGLRQAAADAINRQVPGANVTARNIALAPIRLMEVKARGPNWDGTLRTFPEIEAGSDLISSVSSFPTYLTIKAVGTETVLREIASTSRIDAEYYISGYQIKQNILSWSLANVAALGYHHFLTGDAAWKDLQKYRAQGHIVGLNLGPIQFGTNAANRYVHAERQSFVSRDQVKHVLTRVSRELRGTLWQEFPLEGSILNELQTRMLDSLLDHATSIDALVGADGQLIAGQEILGDIAPDRLEAINQEISDHWILERKRMTQAQDAKAEEHDRVDANTGMTWSHKGGAVIPKSIRLYQMNNSVFSSIARQSFTHAIASKEALRVTDPATFVRVVTRDAVYDELDGEKDFEILQASHISGGDADIDSGTGSEAETFTLTTDTTHDEKRIIVKLTYHFREGEHDFTVLGGEGTVEIPRGRGVRIVEARVGQREARVSHTHGDEWHHFKDLSGDVAGTVLASLSVRGDGPGRDDQGNARFHAVVRVRYKVLMSAAETEELYELR